MAGPFDRHCVGVEVQPNLDRRAAAIADRARRRGGAVQRAALGIAAAISRSSGEKLSPVYGMVRQPSRI